MNGRIYSPSIGRMLSPDPVTQAPENGQNYNRYTYAFNNPLRYRDPSGYRATYCEWNDWCIEERIQRALSPFNGLLFEWLLLPGQPPQGEEVEDSVGGSSPITEAGDSESIASAGEEFVPGVTTRTIRVGVQTRTRWVEVTGGLSGRTDLPASIRAPLRGVITTGIDTFALPDNLWVQIEEQSFIYVDERYEAGYRSDGEGNLDSRYEGFQPISNEYVDYSKPISTQVVDYKWYTDVESGPPDKNVIETYDEYFD